MSLKVRYLLLKSRRISALLSTVIEPLDLTLDTYLMASTIKRLRILFPGPLVLLEPPLSGFLLLATRTPLESLGERQTKTLRKFLKKDKEKSLMAVTLSKPKGMTSLLL